MHPDKIKIFARIHLDDELPQLTLREDKSSSTRKLRFFANIHLDSELQESSLEGGEIQQTAAFLLKMMEDFTQEEKIEFPPELKKAFNELQESPLSLPEEEFQAIQSLYNNPCIEIAPGELKYFPAAFDPDRTRQCLLDYFEKKIHYAPLAEQIRMLHKGESLTIPGGYAGVMGENGHSVIYRFTKEDDQILIEVFNTGAGVSRHFHPETQPSDYYQTDACYRLKEVDDLGKILSSMGLVTVIPTLPKATDPMALQKAAFCNMDIVYDALEKNCERINLKDEALVSKSYVAQQSGTCSVRVFTPLLHKLLCDEAVRNRFKLYYKYRSILNFYQELKADSDSTAHDWELLSLATTKLMRVMRKKINRETFEKENFSEVTANLLEINRHAHKKIMSAKRMPLPIAEEKASLVWTPSYKKTEFQEFKRSREPQMSADHVSLQALTAWIKENQKNSSIKVMVFYEKITQILMTQPYDPFQKRFAIETLIKLLQEKNIQLDTADIDNNKKLGHFLKQSEKIVRILVEQGLHHDAVTLTDIRLTATLSCLVREASIAAMRGPRLAMLWPQEGLYETTANTAGFLEKIRDEKGLSAKEYKHAPITQKLPSQNLDNEMADELMKSEYFLNLYKKVSSKMNPKECLSQLFEIAQRGPEYYKHDSSYTEKELQAFVEFVENESLLGLYSRGGNLLQQLGGFDKDFKTRIIASCNYFKHNTSIQLEFDFKKLKTYPIRAEKIDPLARLRYTLKRATFSFGEKTMQLSMYMNEGNVLGTLIKNKNQSLEITLLALHNLWNSFYNALDYFSRNPSKLIDYYHQEAFLMGIFGGGGRDLSKLNEKNFPLLQSIIDYHFKLFVKERQTSHGLFLLELFIQFREADFSHPWLDNKFEKLLPWLMDVLDLEPPLIQKRILCAQLIEGARDFDAKIASSEEKTSPRVLVKALCDLIALNKKQRELSSQTNDRTFLKANLSYFNLIMKHHDLLRQHPDDLVPMLYPSRTAEEQKKISATLSWETFPQLVMVVDGEQKIFNLAKGEISNKEGWVQCYAIPDVYASRVFGVEFDHQVLIENLKKCSSVSYHSIRVNGIEEEVIARIADQCFHFQRNDKGQPTVFLKRSVKDTDFIYQKMDASCFKDDEIRSVLLENPEYTVWIDSQADDQALILDKDFKTKFSLDLRNKKLTSSESGYQMLLKEQLIKTHPLLFAQLNNFVGHDFRVYQKPGTELMQIDIPGYQISFSNAHGPGGELIFSADQKLKLNTQKQLDFPGSMTLIDEKDNHYLLFPDLPYVGSGKEGYFIKAVPDDDLYSFTTAQNQSASQFQYFKNYRNYFKIKCNDRGQPQPQSFEEKLFICYYYLNNKQYDKALSSIKALLKEETLENSFSVLELIHRIVSESPKKTNLSQGTPFTEAILAIKIRAILLAAKIKISKKIQWPSRPLDFTCFAKLNDVKTFFEIFPDQECANLINKYVRHISQGVYPESWRITDEELRILIDFDFSVKLNQNKHIFQWRGISALKSQISPEGLVAEAKKISVSLNESITESAAFVAHYQSHGYLDKKEEKAFNDRLTAHMSSLEKHTQTKETLLALCHRLQQSNPAIQQAIESQDMTALVFDDLIVAYLRNNAQELAQKLGVPETDPMIPHIFLALQNVLKLAVQLERLQKIQCSYQRMSKPPKDEEVMQWRNALREFDSEYKLTEKNRELLIFEYYEQKRLRASQVSMIEYVLRPGNENCGMQFIMGGGKTSTLLPLAAMKNADGDALSIVIVPESMLAINEKQLDVTTSRLFSAKSLGLYFSRETAVTRDSVLRILNSLKNTQKQRGYLVTSRETLQALELKYLELLSKKEDPECIQLMKEILLLVREKGKAIIDEVDSVLDIRKEFNYSSGDPVALDKVFISDTLGLYRILDSLPQRKPTAENIEKIMADLLDRLTEEKGFLSSLVQRFPKAGLRGYLLGSTVQSDFIKELQPIDRERIALLKHQLTQLLPATLLQELHVNYGASRIPYGDKLYAIPYLCNNLPAEDSQFSSPYETLNLTIQMHLASPLNKPILEKMLKDFYGAHFNESIEKPSMLTEASKRFKVLTGLDLETVYKAFIKEGNLRLLLTFLESHDDKLTAVKYYLIEHTIAPQITYYPKILKSDAISLVNQINSSIGISGTVQNHRTWHERIKLDTSLNPDTDERTLFYLNKKKAKVSAYSKDKITRDNMKSALETMLHHPRTRAIIDLGALFAGITNLDVAQSLREILSVKTTPIRYVLYYDESNHLHALSIADGAIRMLDRTDPDYLEQVLGCSANERMTFYDQSHTTGSDIQQMPHANAVATISQRTRKRDLVQGIMRMRGFEDQQTVEFLVGSNSSHLKNVKDIIQLADKNQKEELLEDHYRAVCKKMTALVRNKFLTILLKASKENAGKAFEALKGRFEWNMASLFEQYGGISTLEKVRTALENHMKNELAVCNKGLKEYAVLDETLDSESIMKSLAKEMGDMITAAVEICKPEVESRVSTMSEQMTIQTQQQTQQHTQQQTQEQQQLFDESMHIKFELCWDWESGLPSHEATALNAFHPAFSKYIYVTSNYSYRDINRRDNPLYLNQVLGYQRENIYCLFSKDNHTGELSCVLLTAQEAALCEATAGCWDEKPECWPNKTYWLEMPSGDIVLKGNKPKDIERDKDYQQMLEQVQFFHGDIDLLMKHETPTWLDHVGRQEANEFMKQVLSNPLFQQKKHYYDEHQKEWQSQFLSTPKEYETIKKRASSYHRNVIQEKYISLFIDHVEHFKRKEPEDKRTSTMSDEINRFFKKRVFSGGCLNWQKTSLSVLNPQEFSLDLIEKFARYAEENCVDKSDPTYLTLQEFIVSYLKALHKNEELVDYKVVEYDGSSSYGQFLQLSTVPYKQFATYLRSLENYNENAHHENKITSERYLEQFLMTISKEATSINDFIHHVSSKLEEYKQQPNPLFIQLNQMVTQYLHWIKAAEALKEDVSSLEKWKKIMGSYSVETEGLFLKKIIQDYEQWMTRKENISTSKQILILRKLRNNLDYYINGIIKTGGEEEYEQHFPLVVALWQKVDNDLNQLQKIIYTHFIQERDIQEEVKSASDTYKDQVSSFEKWQKAVQLFPVTASKGYEHFHQSPFLLQRVGEAYQQWEDVEESEDFMEKMNKLIVLKNAVDHWIRKAQQNNPSEGQGNLRLPMMLALQQRVDSNMRQGERTIYNNFLRKEPKRSLTEKTILRK